MTGPPTRRGRPAEDQAPITSTVTDWESIPQPIIPGPLLDAAECVLGVCLHLDRVQAARLLQPLEPGDFPTTVLEQLARLIHEVIADGDDPEPALVYGRARDQFGKRGAHPIALAIGKVYSLAPTPGMGPRFARLLVEQTCRTSAQWAAWRVQQAAEDGPFEDMLEDWAAVERVRLQSVARLAAT